MRGKQNAIKKHHARFSRIILYIRLKLSRNIHWKFPKFLVNSNFELRMFGIPCTFADLRSSLADINECESNPCVNNGTCNDRINGFNCSCPPGFNGSRCEKGNHNCMLFPGENVTVFSC